MQTINIALCISLVMANSLAEVSNKSMLEGSNQRESYRSPFRYVIVTNERDGYRYVEVLLEDKAFSEKNLKELFRLVSKRFSTPKVLHVQVYTNLEDVETPEEGDEPKVSEAPYDPSSDKHHWAFFLRDNDGNEWFRYNPNPPNTDTKKVVLKGKGP